MPTLQFYDFQTHFRFVCFDVHDIRSPIISRLGLNCIIVILGQECFIPNAGELMSGDPKSNNQSNNNKYQPKATVRHEKIARSKKEELEAVRDRMSDDRYYARKAEASRRKEIKKLPKEERAEAKSKLKEDIAKRKTAEKESKAKYRCDLEAYKGRCYSDDEDEGEEQLKNDKPKKDKASKKAAETSPLKTDDVEEDVEVQSEVTVLDEEAADEEGSEETVQEDAPESKE